MGRSYQAWVLHGIGDLKMEECKFCHEPFRPIKVFNNIDIWETDRNVYVELKNHFGVTRDIFQINYCPACGQKLL